MSRHTSMLPLAGCVLALQLASGAASAHIHLLDPAPRYTDEVAGENKNCPCGVGTAGRRCSIPEERSDPNRSSVRTTTLTGGSMLTVQVDEYVGHSGRYRIAFDPNGADLEDFNQHVLLDIPDPRGAAGNIGNDSLWEFAVQLPNMDCENCTLQVIQMMDGNMADPVLDPVERSSYYQCADLVLTKDTSKPDGYAEPMIVFANADGMPIDPNEDPLAGILPNPPATSGMTGNGTGATAAPMNAAEGDSGGCSIGSSQRGHTGAALGVAALGLVLRVRRRRAR
jgi:MYXO-CTERM domain-containing protein